MVSNNKMITDIDVYFNKAYVQCDDALLAKNIKLSSGGCIRTFPLTDESLAGVCVLSTLSLVMSNLDKDPNMTAFNLMQGLLQELLTFNLSVLIAKTVDRDMLIDMYLFKWEPFIGEVVKIKKMYGMSSEYYNALIDDVTARATRIRMHYGAIKGDEVYASL